ncbi:MAG: LytTR family DNA-binding domain-containing protein [Muribaculaceae bacterium]|nr:LytTR family DNA-binding domain-containing protein [Muribaculaceae bacterium]
MTYAIVEDELLCQNHLGKILAALRPSWQLLFTTETVAATVEQLNSVGVPDIIFLDIELSDGKSFEIFNRYPLNIPVVFTTAFDSYCLQAFRVNSVDYILKPVTTDAVLEAILKFENTTLTQEARISRNSLFNSLVQPSLRSTRILTYAKDSYSFVNSQDIAWIECEDKCVFLITKDGVRHLTTFTTLNEIEESVPHERFFRVTRSVVVAIDSITGVSKSFNYRLTVALKAGSHTCRLKVSAARRKDFLLWFGLGKV